MVTALIGLIGVLVGGFLNEYFRRRSRIEIYSKEVFEKRLSAYEELYKKMEGAFLIAGDIIERSNYSKEERHEVWSEVVLNVAAFTDENGLYLNENLIVHCMLTLIGVEDIYYIEDPKEKKEQVERFGEGYVNAKKLIRKETGLEALDKLFGSISKAKLESDYISYYQRRKKKFGK
jgi:hypothetical protein